MMKSPFPGMDPWLERHWGDVHQSLVTYTRDQLQESLPAGLLARMQERIFVEFSDANPRTIFPDVRVIERGRTSEAAEPSSGGVAVAEPLRIHLQNEPVTEGFVEILDTVSQGRVVTVIEILSPANKHPGKGQDLYARKQRECTEARVNLVEIDLLRAGQRVTDAPPEILPISHRTAYQACVLRGSQPDVAEVYRIPLRERLPAIRVALRATDPDVVLDLQLLIEMAYHKGRYDLSIDYKSDPQPPLSDEDAAWADESLKTLGLR